MTRRLFHQIHLWLSLPLGILFAVICLTGAILVFENEALQLLNPQVDVSSMRKHDPARRELTGYGFFRETLRLHRWLLDAPAKKGERSAGKEVVGYGTLAMTAVLLSGVVVWWPRNKKVLRNRLSVSMGKGWRRFWYDSHVSVGFYATIPLLLMCLTGLVWSFPWWKEAFWSLLDFVPPEGRKRFLYTLHTGSWGGTATKALYFLAALIGAALPLTGYYLWWKRRRAR